MSRAPRMFHLKLLTACIASTFLPQVMAHTSPFPDMPLHLIDSTSTTTSSALKPNVLLQIDTGSTMNCAVGDVNNRNCNAQSTTSRLSVTKRALSSVIKDPQYRNAFHWGFLTSTDGGSTGFNTRSWAEGIANGTRQFGIPSEQLERGVDSLTTTGVGLNFNAARYLDGLYVLEKSMKYRCQQSYYVLFMAGNIGDIGNLRAANRTNSRGCDVDQAQLYFYNNTVPMAVCGGTGSWVTKKGFEEGRTQVGSYWPFTYQHPYPDRFRQSSAGGGGIFKPKDRGNPNLFSFRVREWANNMDIMRYFAETVYLNDLKPSGTDAGGGSWNDPKYNKGKQNITTYAIGMDLDNFAEARYAVNGASVGRSQSSNPQSIQGQAIMVNNEQSLKKAFEEIFNKIKENEQSVNEPPESFSAIAPSVSAEEDKTANADEWVIASYLDLGRGSSELRAYPLARRGQTEVGTTYKTPDMSGRKALIHNGTTVSWLDPNRFSGSNAFFGIPDKQAGGRVTNAQEWKTALIPWLLRSESDANINQKAKDGNFALEYRVRSTSPDRRSVGDIVNSPIVTYANPHGNAEGHHRRFLATAANDGMVYLFAQQNDAEHPFRLLLNYMPAGMEREAADDTVAKYLSKIVHPNYVVDPKQPHRFLVNGGITLRITDNKNSTDKTNPPNQQMFLVGNMGQGGRGAYALNIGGKKRSDGTKIGLDTPDTEWLNTIPMFETPKGSQNTLGYTVGSPQIGRIAFNRTLTKNGNTVTKSTASVEELTQGVFISSGFASPSAGADIEERKKNSESALYIYSALSGVNMGTRELAPGERMQRTFSDGTLIAKLKVDASVGKGGLAEAALVDSDFDGAVDFAYAGDYGGGLYRFDFRGGNESAWTVKKIFQTADNQPITAAPAVLRLDKDYYVVLFGTGTDMFTDDDKLTHQQAFYGIHDDLSNLEPEVKRPSDLLVQTISSTTKDGKKVRQLSDNKLGERYKGKGWYFNLDNTGERVVVKPTVILNTVVFTTRDYQTQTLGDNENEVKDKCVVTTSNKVVGGGWVMQVRGNDGGLIPPNDPNYAYIDFFRESVGKDLDFRPDTIYSGFVPAKGLLRTVAMIFGNKIDPTSSITSDGDTGGSGRDSAAGKSKRSPKKCLRSDEPSLFFTSGSDASNGHDAFAVMGQICKPDIIIRRLSWREIY